jgi:PmbA protein
MARTQTQVQEVVERILGMSTADQTEVSLEQREVVVTRFAGSRIHQPMHEQSLQLRIRILREGRTGSAGTNQLDDASLKETLRRAEEMCSLAPEDEDPVGFCGPGELYTGTPDVEDETRLDPQVGAGAVVQVVQAARIEGQQAAGTYQAEKHLLAVGTSTAGLTLAESTNAFLKVLTSDLRAGTSGWASCMAEDPAGIPVTDIAVTAVAGAAREPGSSAPPAGPVRVVLGPDAVAELVTLLALSCFTPSPYHSGGALTSGKMGEKLFDERISLWDDARDPLTCRTNFDYDGVPCQKVIFIENGLVGGVVYDRETAHRYHARSTGHAQPRPPVFLTGPQANHLFLAPGTLSRDQLLGVVQEGVFITRFQYTSLLDSMDLTISGSTRDGTFLIQDGRITEALPNLSFRSSIVSLLDNLIGLSGEGMLVPGELGPVWVPILAADGFGIL